MTQQTSVFKHTTLTSSVHNSQHDGGDPGHLTWCGIKDDLNVFEEDCDGFGEGVGEADGDEGAYHHCPAPATLGRGVTHRPTHSWRHVCSRRKSPLLEDRWEDLRRPDKVNWDQDSKPVEKRRERKNHSEKVQKYFPFLVLSILSYLLSAGKLNM